MTVSFGRLVGVSASLLSAPDSEWLLCDAVAPVAADGLIGGHASIWAVDGRLLASGGGQLLCRPVPAST